eukprot:CAMPEP_0206497144 /NCGR_PEP_ID=MMETSP0324_2-20121206/49961_1 /ASSEMBLY_ACC=CAM_ASM_000836 /TAXON_ID=2866 /ORGANISM="Crypthecodinium cohnii, Strain Seligo" /LENGTH=64 /DNA_ID=CAMNT_0053982559 /DNA_START=93 /DNA_END=283 /DNA_ORIENTATION=+
MENYGARDDEGGWVGSLEVAGWAGEVAEAFGWPGTSCIAVVQWHLGHALIGKDTVEAPSLRAKV